MPAHFWSPTDLCLIHKVQGLAAKPGPCYNIPSTSPARRRRVRLARLRLHGGARRHGRALAEQMDDVEAGLPAEQRRGPMLPSWGCRRAACPANNLCLQPKQRLHWRNYRTLEAALMGALLNEDRRSSAAARAGSAAAWRRARSAARWAEPSEVLAAWTRDLASQDYGAAGGRRAGHALRAAPARRARPVRRRPEEQWQPGARRAGAAWDAPHPGDRRHQRARAAAASSLGESTKDRCTARASPRTTREWRTSSRGT